MNPACGKLPAIFLSACGCVSAGASIVTYPDLSSFLLANEPVSLESFENAPPLAYTVHPPVDFGRFLISSERKFAVFSTGPSDGQHPTEGAYYLAFQAQTLQFTFKEPITALSLDFIDFGDIGAANGPALSMSTSAGDTVSIKEPGEYGSGNVFFYAFQSDVPVSQITFQLAAGHLETVAVDSVRFAAVPEPSSVALWGCGAIGVICRRRDPRMRLTALPAAR